MPGSPRLHRRGPIEASQALHDLLLCKSSPRLHRRGPIEAFPWVCPRNCLTSGLHGFIAVAQLKPEQQQDLRPTTAPSPRLHRRGPIEAILLPYKSPLWASLHGFIAVAQLKLLVAALLHLAVGRSPRLHRRGPIEAIWYSPLRAVPSHSLHGFIAVAQLKHQHPERYRFRYVRLHGFIAVAQLKRGRGWRV